MYLVPDLGYVRTTMLTKRQITKTWWNGLYCFRIWTSFRLMLKVLMNNACPRCQQMQCKVQGKNRSQIWFQCHVG